MRYVLTEPLTFPPGTVFEASAALGAGGVEAVSDRGCVRLFIGRAAGLREGMLAARPALSIVKGAADAAA